MKLFFSTGSPYACKVMAVTIELGIADRIERIPSSASPVSRNTDISRHNPSGMVPTLLTDADGALFDSHVICDYLGSLVPGNSVVPLAGPARWRALRDQAVADGLLDAALLARYEISLRPEPLRWPQWLDGQMEKVKAALAFIEDAVPVFAGRVDVGTLAAACALGYLDARFPDLGWRDGNPEARRWYDEFRLRLSLNPTEWST